MFGSYARARAQTHARAACQVGGALRARTADGQARTGMRKDARPPLFPPFPSTRAERRQRERAGADVARYNAEELSSGAFLTLHLLGTMTLISTSLALAARH